LKSNQTWQQKALMYIYDHLSPPAVVLLGWVLMYTYNMVYIYMYMKI